MKKTYIKPDMKVIILKSRQVILAGSATTTNLTGHGGWGGISDVDDYAD